MITYNKESLYSFKYNIKLKRELKITREYTRKNKLITDTVYGEKTTNKDVIAIPSEITFNLKDKSPHGFTGKIKSGNYYIDSKQVELFGAHQIYNNIAFVYYKEKVSKL